MAPPQGTSWAEIAEMQKEVRRASPANQKVRSYKGEGFEVLEGVWGWVKGRVQKLRAGAKAKKEAKAEGDVPVEQKHDSKMPSRQESRRPSWSGLREGAWLAGLP